MLIGVSSFALSWGGIQIQMLNHIKNSKHEFIIFADCPGEMVKIFEGLPNVKKIIYCKDFEIGDLAKRENVDVFLHHTVNHTDRGSVSDLRLRKIPVVVFHHCAWKPLYDAMIADKFITTSDNNIEIIKQNPSFKETEIHKIHLSLDFADYQKLSPVAEVKKKWGIPAKKLVIGRFGRIEPGKCPEDFITAAGKIKKQMENVFFIVGGALSFFQSQDYLEVLKDKAKGAGLKEGKDILFTGEMPESAKANLINCFDLYLYPTSWEGYCMAFLEAMYLQKPIVTYDSFANKETVGDGGICVPLGDIDGLTKETLAFLKNPKKRIAMGKKGKALVEKRNGIKDFSEKLDSIIDSLEVIKPAEKKFRVCLVGWGLVDNMESSPEYLQLKYLREVGIEVDFFCVTELGHEELFGTKINRLGFDPKYLSGLPDIVHIHHAENPLALEAARWAKSQGIPIVMNIHSIVNVIDPFLPLVDKFVLFSEKERDEIRQNIPDGKKVIIANGIEIERYKSQGTKFQEEKVQGKKNILFVGQLFEWKGIFRILEVAFRLYQDRQDFCFHIVSHVVGEYEKLKAKIEETGMTEYVKVYPSNHGERSFDELLDYYASCDIIFLPTKLDTFPTSLLEGMASSKPCVATTIGGIANQIDHEVTGFHLLPKWGVEEAINRITELLDSEETREQMGGAGYEKAKREYDIKNQIEKYIQLYHELAEKQ